MLAEIAECSGEKSFAKLICESCGAEFSCGANAAACWCFSVEVRAENLAELRENYERCLCENCLKKSAANYTNNVNGK